MQKQSIDLQRVLEYRRALHRSHATFSQRSRIPLPQAAFEIEGCLNYFITFFQDGVEQHKWLLERDRVNATCSGLLKRSFSPFLR